MKFVLVDQKMNIYKEMFLKGTEKQGIPLNRDWRSKEMTESYQTKTEVGLSPDRRQKYFPDTNKKPGVENDKQ